MHFASLGALISSPGLHLTWQDILCTDQLAQAESCCSTFQMGTCTVLQMRSPEDNNAPWDIHIHSDCLLPLQCYHSSTRLSIPCIQMNTDYLDTCHLDSVLEGVIFSRRSVQQYKDMNLVLKRSGLVYNSNLCRIHHQDSSDHCYCRTYQQYIVDTRTHSHVSCLVNSSLVDMAVVQVTPMDNSVPLCILFDVCCWIPVDSNSQGRMGQLYHEARADHRTCQLCMLSYCVSLEDRSGRVYNVLHLA